MRAGHFIQSIRAIKRGKKMSATESLAKFLARDFNELSAFKSFVEEP